MRPYSSINKRMNFNKRRTNSIPENVSSLSTAYRSSKNIQFPNSIRNSKNHQNKSQLLSNNKLSFFDSTNNNNLSYHPRLLTPKYKINLKNSLIQKESLKILNNEAIYNSIISKIENIMIKYKQDIKKLYFILSNIDNFINIINKGNYLNIKMNTIKNNFQISFIINDENIDDNEIVSPNSKNKTNISNNNQVEVDKLESDINIYKRKVNKLSTKINEIENKFKIEKLKYLFCIGEYQKRLTDLEKKLNMDSIDKMPKDELKKYLCYPHYVKFNNKEEINPKSVPMFNMGKKKCQSSVHDNRINKNNLSKSDIEFNCDNDLKNNKDNNLNSFDFLSDIKIDNNNNEKTNLNDIEEENIVEKEKEIKFEQVKNIIELGKKNFDSKTQILDKLFGNDKTFFISHPKLNYIKNLNNGNKMATWKLENQINSLPQQLSKLRMLSKTQKKAIVVFPSFLNETIVNLEKLRTNKNFRSIENKFQEKFKMKLKN